METTNKILKYINQCIQHYEDLNRLGAITTFDRTQWDVLKSVKEKILQIISEK